MAGSARNVEHAPGTPDEVKGLNPLGRGGREPVTDPTLGISLPTKPGRGPRSPGKPSTPANRLVTIGDSLTHGFQSGAIFHTDLSYPAIIAHELGWSEHFRRPSYEGYGGLPINIEVLLRELEGRFGRKVDWWEVPQALYHGRRYMDQVEDYWERGPGTVIPRTRRINHNLSVYGWDLRDVLVKTAESCEEAIDKPKDDLLHQMVQNNCERAALRVLPSLTDKDRSLTALAAAARLGEEVRKDTGAGTEGRNGNGDPDHGIETLIVFLGSNNALPAVTQLKAVWSGDGYDDPDRKGQYTVWRPSHFKAELAQVADQIRTIKARHVIWCTVPHVTIAPIARGVAGKMEPGSRYFPYYTRPWISDREFNPRRDPHLTHTQARDIDRAIDQYNDDIVTVVRDARNAGRDWYLLDTAGLLDRLASRRYIDDPLARPPWWQPYPLPPELRALVPVPDSRFLTSDGRRRSGGGLFSLDGVHPTTVGYGILAHELIKVMRIAGVEFRQPDGVTVRPDPVGVDFARLIRRDTLISRPPGNLTSGLHILGWADQALDLFRHTLHFRF